MKTLIFYAHPGNEGHSSTILENVKSSLEGIEYELIDLYKLKYNPVLSKEEHYTSGEKLLNKDTQEFQKKIADADHMIFIYPIWWGTMPAILKGFFDRTFTSGFAFKYENGMPKGLLKGKKAVIFITSGAPTIITEFIQAGRVRKSIKSDILSFCGIKSRVFQIGNATKLTDAQKNKIRSSVKKGIKWLYN